MSDTEFLIKEFLIPPVQMYFKTVLCGQIMYLGPVMKDWSR